MKKMCLSAVIDAVHDIATNYILRHTICMLGLCRFIYRRVSDYDEINSKQLTQMSFLFIDTLLCLFLSYNKNVEFKIVSSVKIMMSSVT